MIQHPARRLAWAAIVSTALLAGCFGSTAQEDVAVARTAIEKGDRSAAIIQLKNALQKNPDMADARYLLARMLYETGNAQSSWIELEKAAKLGFSETSLVPLQARLMLVRGENGKIVEQFATKKLNGTSEQVSLLTSLAMAYGAQRKFDQALQSLDEALKLEPSNRLARLVRIRVIGAQSGVDAATKEINAYLASEPKDSEAWQIKGEFAAASGQFDESIAAYQQAIATSKRNLAAQSALISLLLDKKDLASASAQLANLRSVAPKNLETEFLSAALALARNEIKEANERIQRVLKAAPGDPRVIQLAAGINLKRGALLEADVQLGKLLLANPDNTAARLMQSRLQLRLGDANKAETILQPLLVVPNPSAEALTLAAEIQMSQGEFRSADDYLIKVAKLNPDDVRVRVALAMSTVRNGKVEQGIEELRAIAAKDSAVDAEMALVNIYLQRREYPQALAMADAMERKVPGRASVAALHGRINTLRGEPQKASQDFELALKLDPHYYPAVEAANALDASSGKLAQAQARLQLFLQANPGHAQAQLASIALRDKAGAKPNETVQALRALIRQMPSEMAPRQVLINFQLEQKENEQALAAAQEAVAALPESPELWMGLGRAQTELGSYDQAITSFNRLIELRPKVPASYLPLAELYVSRKDHAAAKRALERALSIKPDFLPAQIELMQIANATGNKADALKLAKSVQLQQPQSPLGLVMAGDSELSSKSWDAAAQNYRAALAKGAGGDVAVKLDAALLVAKREAESAKFEADWLVAHPKDELFLFHLGGVAIAHNDLARAEERFRTVLKLSPDNVASLNNLAWVLVKTKKPGALEMAEKANALAPNQASYMDTLAEAYAQAGQMPKAIETQKKVVALTPENHSSRLTLARYYLSAGQKDAAREELKRLAVLGDKVPQQQEVKQLLGTL